MQLTLKDRIRLEAYLDEKMPVRLIAVRLNKHISSIYDEIHRGTVICLDTYLCKYKRYSAEVGQQKHNYESTNKGRSLKLANYREFAQFVEKKIVEKYSPAAILALIRAQTDIKYPRICEKTLYNYIYAGYIKTPGRIIYKKKKKKKRVIRELKAPHGRSIELRPPEVLERKTFGHWELDSVVGTRSGSGSSLLVLTERKTNYEIIIKTKGKTSSETAKQLRKLKNQYGKVYNSIFKTITCDNGSEFKGLKLKNLYYCHPYCSSERGQNEKNNTFIRRKIPKSSNIEQYSDKFIKTVEDFINTYPRKMYNWRSSYEEFQKELKNL